ncbi:MAG TPA: hypothetical protein H9910_06415 [Candidatus Mediterraneibacter quadrami]|uniref:Uncharacterized protein n=1 Tax=Candidatus Mediterraneibacter quadrami TaxID=2838684 RepID=A0A9D2RFU5_9FIRM|nr:hypothetical protein [Candidatus Mediterraneibacter quadrami]
MPETRINAIHGVISAESPVCATTSSSPSSAASVSRYPAFSVMTVLPLSAV